MMQKPPGGIPSPCVRNCCLDKADICLGCGRSLAEIIHWHSASDDERRTILQSATRRKRQQQGPIKRD